MSEKNVANSKPRMSSSMPASRNCCCNTAASSRVDSSVEDLTCARWIVRILFDIAVVGPVLRRQNAVCGLRLVTQQIMNDRPHIDGVRDGTPYANILQNGIAQVHRQIRVDGSRRLHDREVSIALQRDNGVSGQCDRNL